MMNGPEPNWRRRNLRYLRLLDGAVLLTLAGLVLYTASRHEPWADEAQTWLVARDFGWLRLVFSELRYEGHPPLWYAILWPAIHFFHMPYAYFGYLGGSIAISGLAVLIFLAPFPRPLRYLIGSSFFFVYQYAVVARSYVLLPLLGFLAAYFYRRGLRRIMAFAVCIALLIQASTYTAVIAVAFAIFYALQLASTWRQIVAEDRRRVIMAGALVALSVVLFIVVVLPPSDSAVMADSTSRTLQRHLELFVEGLVGAFTDSAFVTIPFLLLAGIWARERGGLLLMILSVGGTAAVYGFVWGFAHHQGVITAALVVSVWAAWPTEEQLGNLPLDSRRIHQALLAALLLMFGWHCTWSYAAIRKDWAGPYSGALDAAMFLKSVHADKLGCRGYNYWSVAIEPYFDRNIFVNKGGPEAPASFHASLVYLRKV